MVPPSALDTGIHEPRTRRTSHHAKHDSNVSVGTRDSTTSTRSHKEYLDSLVPPTQEVLQQIATAQEHKEEAAIMRRLSVDRPQLSEEERRRKAAAVIQRNYRGHRERRILQGKTLDPSTRWAEAVKEARYRQMTEPQARASMGEGGPDGGPGAGPGRSNSLARQKWKKVGLITRRAGGDEESDTNSEDDQSAPEEEREERRKRRMEEKLRRQKAAKLMDLQYFLEMVDLKHRYGSNLRVYHEEWKKSDTQESFFYWLDYGEGRFIDCQACSREKLDREQVRYLSKEERLNYLVKIDNEGRLCWVKNGARIDTTDKFKDSIHGIVPNADPTPAYAPVTAKAVPELRDTSSDTSSISSGLTDHGRETDGEGDAKRYANPELDHAVGIKKVRQVSAATILNKLLRGTVKKNTWIFVADTSFRLYVGIKQSGAFQHSSFLHGSRISAAGLIKIKNGRITKLSPLSGHYRPPVKNFRAFVNSLNDAGADMSHVSISRSYAILVGLETYIAGRRRAKSLVHRIMHGSDKVISPEEVARREEQEREKSESVERERRFLELKQQMDEEDGEPKKGSAKLRDKLHIGTRVSGHG